MKNSTRLFTGLLMVLFFFLTAQTVHGQSILNPSDTIVTFNPADTPAIPAYGSIAKWIRTVRMSWNTSSWKCYIYNGHQFRLRFPPDYNPTANDGKVYPMLIFMHGDGEGGSVYDNEYSLYHGGDVFEAGVSNGTFDGYVLVMQTPGSWGANEMIAQQYIVDYMIQNNKLDPFRVYLNGLSAGGSGDWEFLESAPTYPAAVLPMSSVDIDFANSDTVSKWKYTPIWCITGGLDGSPTPFTAQNVASAFSAAGANYTYLDMTTQGHDTWDSTWSMSTFWPWLKAQYSSNPWTLFGRTQFCSSDSINLTIGLMAGFQGYQWRKNGTVISGATSNTINVTSVGTYDARVERKGIWSSWSPVPAVISIKAPTVTPPITVSGLMSDVLPGTDNKNFVTLTVPDSNYTSYTWEKVGKDSVIGTQSTLKVTQPGQYIVSVTQQFGCSSNFSPPFRVVNANGPNPPSAASNLVASALSFTQVELVWARNPHPANPETGFEIYRATNVTGPYTFAGLVPADTVDFLDNGLQPNVKYYYVVRAVDSTGAAALSNQAVVITESDKTAPTAPANLHVVTTSSTSVTLGWNSSTDNVAVTGYYIYVNGAKSYAQAAGDTTFVVSDLTPNQDYSFFVVAVDGSGNSSIHSNQVSGASVNTGLSYSYYNLSSQPGVMPNFPTLTPTFSGNMPNVSIANATSTTNFAYLWNGYINIPVTGNYVFQTVSDDGSQVWLGSLNQSAFPYSFSGTPIVNANQPQGATATNSATLTLQAGTYPISVAYFQAAGGYSMVLNWSTPASGGSFVAVPNSAFASSFTPAGTPPARPSNITASATAYNKVSVGWTDNSNNETGFEIYRSTGSGGTMTIVGSAGPNVTSFVDSSVQGSTTYSYAVQALNVYGASGFDSLSLSGISYSFYQGVWNIMPPFATTTPVSTGHLNNFSLSPAGSVTTDYAFKFSGFINIPTTGSYTFYTTSDDGSDLYIGGFDSAHLVVENDFLQGATQRSGTVSLTQGRYPIYVTYVQQGGDYVLSAAYKGPGIAQQNIPDSALYNRASMATTPGVPAIPSAPYGVTAQALSPSRVGISWSDSSATVTGYQIYRSISDTVHYVSFASVAAGTVSFTDTALFSNAVYYYKVIANGVSGNSGYSPMASATTPDVLPVITKLPANEQARYGTTTVFNVSATSVNSGALTFTAANLPSFATFTDNGNGTGTLTVTPTVANAGSYPGLSILVTDIYGGADTTRFNLTVNDNYPPVLDTIVNYTINEGDTLSIALAGSNQNPSDTLSLSATNLPAGSTLTTVSNGTGKLFIHANYASTGTYPIQVTLTDNNGLSVTRTFTLTVNYRNPVSKIFTRVVYNDAGALGLPWNGLLGTSTSNLLDSSGNATGMGLNFSPSDWWTPFNGGSSTGNNSGVYPDEVLLNYMWFGSLYGGPNTFAGTVTGADTSSLYDLTFYANSTYSGFGDNGWTTYTAGGQTVQLHVQNNKYNTVTISSLKPAADGTLPFVMGLLNNNNTQLGYFSALVITKHFDDGSAPAGVSGLTATDEPGQVQLSWTDSAYNATGYEVWRALTSNGSYSLLGTAAGNSTSSYIDSTVAGSTGYTYKVRAVNTHGNSPFDSVSTVTLHRLPKITAIQNIIMKDTQTVTVNVTTTDDSTAQLTLTATNLPPFASFTDNGNGTGVLTLAPSAGTVGMYSNVSITVTDSYDSTAMTSFSIAVTEPNVQSVYMNFTGGPSSPAPWNTMTTAPFQGTVLSNMRDDSGTPSGISATLLDGWYWYGTTGYVTGNSDGVYPPSVIQNFYFDPSTNTRRIQISGLNNAKQYNFVFFNSQWDGTNGLTTFTINSDSVQLQPDWNISKTVQINGITPVSGVVTIGVHKASGAANAYLNSIVIQGYDTAAGTLLSPADLRVLNKTQTTVRLQWQDRSAIETGYEVWKASDSTGSYSLLATLPANATTYRDSLLGRGANYYYIVRAVDGGTYSNYSNVLAVTTYGDAIYVHPSTSVAGAGPTPPWNNLNSGGGVGTSWSNFIDSTGAATSVGMVQTGEFAGANALGDVTGNNSGVYPDPVLLQQYVLFPGNFGAFTLSGLNLSKTYDFTFFGSESYEGGNNNTGYIVNGDTVYLNALDNTNATVTLHGVVPSALGQANIMMYCPSGSIAGWFNAMVINGYTPLAQNPPTVPPLSGAGGSNTTINTATGNQFNAQSATLNADSVIQAYPNPFHTSFTLSVPVFANGEKLMVTLFDANGRLVYKKEFDNVQEGVNYLSIGEDANIGAPGIYVGKVIFSSGRAAQNFKVIKN